MVTSSRPLRVLLVSHLSSLSGAEQALLRLVTHYDRQRVQPIVVLPSNGPLLGELTAAGASVRILPIGWWIPATHWSAQEYASQLEGLPARASTLQALAMDERIDLIHTNTIVTLEGALAAAAAGLPHIWHSRGTFSGPFPPAYTDWRFFMRFVDILCEEILCTSEAVARQAAEVCRFARLHVVHDGMDIAGFLQRPVTPRSEIAAQLAIDAARRWIVSAGGIQRRKRQLDLVDAMGMIAPKHPDSILILCGDDTDPEYAAAVDARIAELSLSARVRRAGFWRDMRSLLAAAEVFAHSSESEGFGLAILEAMAAGTPVVATRSGGPDEIIEDHVSGLLVPVGDPAALAAALDSILSDRTRRAAMAASAATRAWQFDQTACVRETEKAYARTAAAIEHVRAWQPARASTSEVLMEAVLERARRAADATMPRG